MNTTSNTIPWDQFPTECFFYLLFLVQLQVALFIFGSLVLALLPRKQPNTLMTRIVRYGLFLTLLLVVGASFNGLWSLFIFNRLYYSADYSVDFFPFWPITQAVIDARFGDEKGKLLGVTLTQLQFVWLLFACGTWVATILLYRWIKRLLGNVESRNMPASLVLTLILFLSSMLTVAGVWNMIAPDRLYHYRYGSPPLSNFIPPFLHPPNDAATVGPEPGSFIWPERSVYAVWIGFITAGLAVPVLIYWRIKRDATLKITSV